VLSGLPLIVGESPFCPFENLLSGESKFTTSSRRIDSANVSPQGSSLCTIIFGETKLNQSDLISSRSAGFARNRAAAWAVSLTLINRVRSLAKAVAGRSFARRRRGACIE